MATKAQSEAKYARAGILLVDDHPIVLQGLTQLINQETDLTVCGQAMDAQKALNLIEQSRPDLVIVDIVLRGGNGLELIKTLRVRYPKLPVLVLSMHDELLYAERALRAGAKGYVMKCEAIEKLLTAIRRVLQGEIYLSDKISSKILSRLINGRPSESISLLDLLSDRELEVFQLIGRGYRTREIAGQLHLSVKTIEAHRENIKEKLKIENATELVQRATSWVQALRER